MCMRHFSKRLDDKNLYLKMSRSRIKLMLYAKYKNKSGVWKTKFEVISIFLEIKLAYDDKENVKQLFDEYTKFLVDLDSIFQDYLHLQNYDSEIYSLHEKYGLPMGRLYIAYFNNQAAGCIALRQMSDTECEMKRLYVRPKFGGNKIGETLVETIISDAKEIGYKFMLLDTLPSLSRAVKLYENMGFYKIPPYNNSPIDNTIFMRLDLHTE